VTTTWKVIDGNWFWYVDEEGSKHAETPMGRMNAGPKEAAAPTGMPADFSKMINDPARRAEFVESLRNKVAISKTEVTLPLRKAASETVEIANRLDGPINIEFEVAGKVPGLTVKLDKPMVAAGGKILVQIKYVPAKTPPTGPSANVTLHVTQTGQAFNIPIRFTP
jgi:hypothetical protein